MENNKEQLQELIQYTNNIEIVDNHLHPLSKNIIKPLSILLSENHNDEDIIPLNQQNLATIRNHKLVQKELFKIKQEDLQTQSEFTDKLRNNIEIEEYTSRCLKQSNTSVLLIDDGLIAPDNYMFYSQEEINEKFTGVQAYRVLRIERECEIIIQKAVAGNTSTDLKQLLMKLCQEIDNLIKNMDKNIVSLKSIAAYRCGLKLQPKLQKNSSPKVQNDYYQLIYQGLFETMKNKRLDNINLISFILHRIFNLMNTEKQYAVPVQFHTGFGDTDLSLEQSNPLLLKKEIIEEYPNVPIVLLHGSYPYTQDAGFLANVYKNVYLDLGLAAPLLNTQGIRSVIKQMLQFAPTNKILYSSDAHTNPDALFLASHLIRQELVNILFKQANDEMLNTDDIKIIIKNILRNNSLNLYTKININNQENAKNIQN